MAIRRYMVEDPRFWEKETVNSYNFNQDKYINAFR